MMWWYFTFICAIIIVLLFIFREQLYYVKRTLSNVRWAANRAIKVFTHLQGNMYNVLGWITTFNEYVEERRTSLEIVDDRMVVINFFYRKKRHAVVLPYDSQSTNQNEVWLYSTYSGINGRRLRVTQPPFIPYFEPPPGMYYRVDGHNTAITNGFSDI